MSRRLRPFTSALNWQAEAFYAFHSTPQCRVLDKLPLFPNRNHGATDRHPSPPSSSHIRNKVVVDTIPSRYAARCASRFEEPQRVSGGSLPPIVIE